MAAQDDPILCMVRCNWPIHEIMYFLRLYQVNGNKHADYPYRLVYKNGELTDRTVMLLPSAVFDGLDTDYFVLTEDMTIKERKDRVGVLHTIRYPIWFERYRIIGMPTGRGNLCIYNSRLHISALKIRMTILEDMGLFRSDDYHIKLAHGSLFVNFQPKVSAEHRMWCKELLNETVTAIGGNIKFV